jgi:hypothetical protein
VWRCHDRARPADARVDSRPISALREVRIDYCKPARELASLIARLVAT